MAVDATKGDGGGKSRVHGALSSAPAAQSQIGCASASPSLSRRPDEPVSVGSLPLKGGGQEGVGATSSCSVGTRRGPTKTGVLLKQRGMTMRHAVQIALNSEGIARGTDPP